MNESRKDEQMNAQEFFDKTVNAIRAQGKPSIGPNGCRYRGIGGLKCAVGHHITDDEYSPEMEYLGCSHWEFLSMLPDGHVLKEYVRLARSMQASHDRAARSGNFLGDFERRVRIVAEEYELVYTPPGN